MENLHFLNWKSTSWKLLCTSLHYFIFLIGLSDQITNFNFSDTWFHTTLCFCFTRWSQIRVPGLNFRHCAILQSTFFDSNKSTQNKWKIQLNTNICTTVIKTMFSYIGNEFTIFHNINIYTSVCIYIYIYIYICVYIHLYYF